MKNGSKVIYADTGYKSAAIAFLQALAAVNRLLSQLYIKISDFISGMGLQLKWTLLTIVLVISFSTAILTYFLHAGSVNLKNELKKWSLSLAQNMAANAPYAETTKNLPILQNYLSGTMLQKELLYAIILDSDGSILAKVDNNWMFTPEMHDLSMESQETEIINGFFPDLTLYYNLVYKHKTSTVEESPINQITANRSKTIKVILGISLKDMNEQIDHMRERAILLTFFVALIIFFWVWWSVKKITSPINDLVRATKKVARGNLTSFIENDRRDELGILADSFNKMLVRLNRSKEREKQYTMELEKKVQERTRELKSSEDKYRTLFEHSATAVTLFHEDDMILMVNREFEILSGYIKEEVEGDMSFLKFLENKDQTKIRENYLNRRIAEVGNSPISYDCTFIDRQNKHKNVNLTLTAVPGTKNILASLADVTELRGLQKKVIHSEQLAAIGELSASIAHEIRNPLGAINTSIGILTDEMDLQGENRELMDIISEESMRLKAIIDDFLHFTHPGIPAVTDVDVNAIIKETLLLFKTKMSKRIMKRLSLNEDISTVQADPNQLRQVLINIVVNAMEMMPDKGTLTFITRSRNNRFGSQFIEIECQDTGRGIEKQEIDKIFQPFYSTKAKGTGMGLPICERIIQNHGGEIRVESIVDKGTRFIITLPVIPRVSSNN